MNTVVTSVAKLQHCSNKQSIIPGNIIPNEWYQKFTDKRGAPDLAVISILAEIVYWYRPKKVKDSDSGEISYITKFKDDAWQTSYDHFEQKFCLNRERIRRSLVKLEEMGIIAREFRTVTLRGQKYSNRLFIHLAAGFLKSLVVNNNKNEEEQREQGGSDNSSNKGASSDVSIDSVTPQFVGGYPQIDGQYIGNKNRKNKFRSNELVSIKTNSESNFVKSNLEKEEESRAVIQEKIANTSIETTVTTKPKQLATPRNLKDFYPLSQQLCDRLQIESGREFNLNAMNEILLDMSKRLPDRTFFSNKGFISYMAKALKYEMRDAVKISNNSFRIRRNQTTGDDSLKYREKYLTEIENNKEITPEWHLKKKLACVLSASKSYQLLKSYKSGNRVGDIFKLKLDKYIELTKLEKEIILKQVQASHDRMGKDGIYQPITEISILMPSKKAKIISANNQQSLSPNPNLPSGIWGKIRQSLIRQYGESIDKSWFSKLEAKIEEKDKKLSLTAPSEFIKDWIERNYQQTIEKTTNQHGFRVGWT